ncbi:MAG TPA: hypothetical protein VF914_20085 [Chloroflexia bacterium]|jgi:hypothetical protein
MTATHLALLAGLSRLKEIVVSWLPFGPARDAADEPLAGKLKDLRWSDPEDEETARRQAAGQAGATPSPKQSTTHAHRTLSVRTSKCPTTP